MIRSEALRAAALGIALATPALSVPAWATGALDPDFVDFLAENAADITAVRADNSNHPDNFEMVAWLQDWWTPGTKPANPSGTTAPTQETSP